MLLGPKASEEDIALASLSITGQWVFFLFGRRMFEFQFPAMAGNPGLVDQLADHIADFSIAAIRARRAQLEGERSRREPIASAASPVAPVPRKPGMTIRS